MIVGVKTQVYVDTFEDRVAYTLVVQALVTTWLFGSVITQLTAPVDCMAPAIPVMVVVNVVA